MKKIAHKTISGFLKIGGYFWVLKTTRYFKGWSIKKHAYVFGTLTLVDVIFILRYLFQLQNSISDPISNLYFDTCSDCT